MEIVELYQHLASVGLALSGFYIIKMFTKIGGYNGGHLAQIVKKLLQHVSYTQK